MQIGSLFRIGALEVMAREQGVAVEDVPKKTLDGLTRGANHQGVVARYRGGSAATESDLDRILEAAGKAPILLVLDGVQDPHNLGACLRTAAAAGVNAVIAPKDNAVGLTPIARKAASGGAEIVPFIQVTNLARTLDRLKQAGFWVVGAVGEADRSLYEVDLKGPLIVAMGAEGSGLRRLTRERCDFLAAIPMAASMESLNVSAATAVILFEAVRQRLT